MIKTFLATLALCGMVSAFAAAERAGAEPGPLFDGAVAAAPDAPLEAPGTAPDSTTVAIIAAGLLGLCGVGLRRRRGR